MTAYPVVPAEPLPATGLDRPGTLRVALDRLEARCGAFRGGDVGDGNSGLPLVGDLAAREPFATLVNELDLDDLELDLLLVALAPTLDPGFGDLYAALQDDPARRRPSVRLALWLAGFGLAGFGSRGFGSRGFGSRGLPEEGVAPDTVSDLVARAALALVPDRDDGSWLGDALEPDHQVTRVALGAEGLDPRLAPHTRLLVPAVRLDGVPVSADLRRAAAGAVLAAGEAGTPLRLHLHGRDRLVAGELSEAVATGAGRPLLVTDVPRLLRAETDSVGGLRLLLREARLFDRSVLLERVDLLAADPLRWEAACDLLANQPGLVLLTGSGPLPGAGGARPGILSVALPPPGPVQREDMWRTRLRDAGGLAEAGDTAAVAAQFQLRADQIADAAEAAVLGAAWSAGAGTSRPRRVPVGRQALFAGARAVSRTALEDLAQRVEPAASFTDLVLPDEALAQLLEIADRVALRTKVLDDWGFGRRSSRGTGVVALFAGASGTGKTTAAEAIAREVGLDLYRIEIAGLVSKYIGETEKNLDRVFSAARDANAVLLFDEADALFGKRSEVRDAHDRYANVETAYLLQRLEDHEGCAILATNLPHNMDEAFVRRLSFTVHFPLPDEAARARIWASVWPPELPLAPGLDLTWVAQRFRTTGGMIRGAALGAAYRAAAAERPVELGDVLHALRREYHKLGKALDENELTPPEDAP